jgi:hypothetical protein
MVMLSPLQSGWGGSAMLVQAANSAVIIKINKGITMRWICFMHSLLSVDPIFQASSGKQAASNHPQRA